MRRYRNALLKPSHAANALRLQLLSGGPCWSHDELAEALGGVSGVEEVQVRGRKSELAADKGRGGTGAGRRGQSVLSFVAGTPCRRLKHIQVPHFSYQKHKHACAQYLNMRPCPPPSLHSLLLLLLPAGVCCLLPVQLPP